MSTIDRLVDAGKAFACSIYRQQPGALIPNPISDVLHLVWDDLCGDDSGGLPAPPTTQFLGGQCQNIGYTITYQYRFEFRGNTIDDNRTYQVWGKILSVAFEVRSSGVLFSLTNCYGVWPNTPSTSPILLESEGFQTAGTTNLRLVGVVIVRIDGQPDNCGNPPSAYPPAPPPPVGGYNSPPTNITYNDGSDFTVVFNLKPPVPSDTPPPPDICLSVIVSGVEVKLCFPFGLPPSFGDDGGDIGDILADIQNNINNLQDDLDNLQDDFDRFTDPPSPESDPDLEETDSPGDEGGEEDNLEGLKWVVVQLTTLPVKAQFGSPSVQFAGWITFKIGSNYTDRIPISFENTVFQAPPGSTGYGITFTNKAKGISKAYTRDLAP